MVVTADDERVWTAQAVYDSLAGTTPNGALADSAQTFVTPSGRATDTIGANKKPLTTFMIPGLGSRLAMVTRF